MVGSLNFAPMKRIKKCHFSDNWLTHDSYKRWISRATSPTEAHCFICNKNFSLSNIGVRAVMSHEQSKKHQLLLERVTAAAAASSSSSTTPGSNHQSHHHLRDIDTISADIISSNQTIQKNPSTTPTTTTTTGLGQTTDFLWSKALISALGSLNQSAQTISAQQNPNPAVIDQFLNSFSYNNLNISRFVDSSPSLDNQTSVYSQNSPSSSTNQSSASPRPSYQKKAGGGGEQDCITNTFLNNNNGDERDLHTENGSNGLTKCQLRQALIHLINRDDDFLSSLHQAYCDCLQDRMKSPVNGSILSATINSNSVAVNAAHSTLVTTTTAASGSLTPDENQI